MSFNDEVRDWLRQRRIGVVGVANVKCSSWEMNDTDACGCDRIEIDLTWYDERGQIHYEYFDGPDVKSLWDWLMGADIRHAGVTP